MSAPPYRRPLFAALVLAGVALALGVAWGQGPDKRKLRAAVRAADVIFVADVRGVGAPPPVWSGGYETTQTVRYRVVRVIDGKLAAKRVTVAHMVVRGSTQARGRRKVGLSPTRFAKGRRRIVLATREKGGRLKVADENVGVLAFNERNERLVRRELKG